MACVLALGVWAGASLAVIAAEAPGTSIVAIAADAVVPQVQVTLEARRLPLSKVLAAIKKQTGADLTIAEGTFAREPKLTLSVTEMPLREWMESLAKLYDVVWQAAGPNTFQLKTSGLSEDEKALRHVGNSYNYWAWPFHDTGRPKYLPPRAAPDWKALVDDNLDLNAITTTGVPLADAPAELQQAVRAAVEHEVAANLLHDTLLLNGAQGLLRVSVTRPPGGSGYISNKGRRNEKRVFTQNPLAADIIDKEGVSIGSFDFRPPSRGRELLNDFWLFPPDERAATPGATAPQEGR